MSFDPIRYAQGLLRANAEERTKIECRLEEAFSEAARVARLIKDNDATVRAVYLFGSVARRDARTLHFDIDLALEGGDTFKAMDVTEESAFAIDVVNLSLLSASVRKVILEQGILL